MIYLVLGKDFSKSQRRFKALAEDFQKQSGPLAVFKLEADNFREAHFEELLAGQGLFGEKFLVTGRRLLEEPGPADFIRAHLEKCARSQNIFLFWEEEMEKDTLKEFKKRAEKIFEFHFALPEQPDRSKEIFKLTDAAALRRRKQTFALFHQLLLSGIDAEEIFWLLKWQFKNISLVKSSPGLLEAKTGLHPFVIKKCREAAGLFSREELYSFSRDLVGLYHNCRYGMDDMALGLERFILRL